MRYFGLMANRHRKENLAKCRSLLGERVTRETELPAPPPEQMEEIEEADDDPRPSCPVCHVGKMNRIEALQALVQANQPFLSGALAPRPPPG